MGGKKHCLDFCQRNRRDSSKNGREEVGGGGSPCILYRREYCIPPRVTAVQCRSARRCMRSHWYANSKKHGHCSINQRMDHIFFAFSLSTSQTSHDYKDLNNTQIAKMGTGILKTIHRVMNTDCNRQSSSAFLF